MFAGLTRCNDEVRVVVRSQHSVQGTKPGLLKAKNACWPMHSSEQKVCFSDPHKLPSAGLGSAVVVETMDYFVIFLAHIASSNTD
jgi:hypothetical protein